MVGSSTNLEPLPAHRVAAEAAQVAAYRRMAPGRRLELAVAMQRDARALMDAGLKQTHPHLSAEERRREIARRVLHASR